MTKNLINSGIPLREASRRERHKTQSEEARGFLLLTIGMQDIVDKDHKKTRMLT